MPPLPTKYSEDAKSFIDTLERRSRHLSETQIPALRDCAGPLSVQQELAEELREDLAAFARQIENLDAMLDDQKGERARRELNSVVQGFKGALSELRIAMRAAVLTSKQAIDSQKRSQKDELFHYNGISESEKQAQMGNEKFGEDALMRANADVTDALRRTIESMQAELEKSVLSNQLLEQSTAALRSTSTQHDTLSNVIETTKHIVTALEKSDWLDRVLLISAFAFFILVVLFILKQRLLDRGIQMVFWWTRFIPDFSGDAELLESAEKGSASAIAGISSAVTGVVSVASVVVSSLSATASVSTTPSVEVETMVSLQSEFAESSAKLGSEILESIVPSLSSPSPVSVSDTDSSRTTSSVPERDEL
ncbi:Sec20-domain-containing protein [Coprinopsis marcescibilis]|uniref:Sec20-domain-containing protein n=1 Tax=Coprinopsis marcescibilis TaxID=230819 RepID=A0A5C3L241_COPMA|nr:Sec20-domain-containing protein [Coprinopsis marcescibilis]